MVAAQRTKIFFKKMKENCYSTPQWIRQNVDAQNFLAYHVSPCEWLNVDWICLKGILSQKLYTGLVRLPNG
jgi:hypothetical protein